MLMYPIIGCNFKSTTHHPAEMFELHLVRLSLQFCTVQHAVGSWHCTLYSDLSNYHEKGMTPEELCVVNYPGLLEEERSLLRIKWYRICIDRCPILQSERETVIKCFRFQAETAVLFFFFLPSRIFYEPLF